MDDDGRALGDGGHARAGGGAGRAQIDGGFRRRIVREAIRDAAGFGRVCRHLLGVLLEDIADLPVIGDAEEIAACARDGQNRSLRDTGDDVALRRRGAAAQVGIRIHGRAVRIACPCRQREGSQAAQQTAERQQAAQESACGRFGHEPVPPESKTISGMYFGCKLRLSIKKAGAELPSFIVPIWAENVNRSRILLRDGWVNLQLCF